MTTEAKTFREYYVPATTNNWPILGSVALFFMALGASLWLNRIGIGSILLLAGLALLLLMMAAWFSLVVAESLANRYHLREDHSFRSGMVWFIFSEVMFFAAFFGALYYVRLFSVPWLGGEGNGFQTHEQIWPGYIPHWPTNGPAEHGGEFIAMKATGIPLVNTCLLLASGVTITFAHHALLKAQRTALVLWMAATVVLGVIFLGFQAYEYGHAWIDLNLTLSSGVYGSTFYMLTGFHGFHVTVGAIMLVVITMRCMAGHFSPSSHFAFEGVAWYWHFVDVVWLGLFFFVYCL